MKLVKFAMVIAVVMIMAACSSQKKDFDVVAKDGQKGTSDTRGNTSLRPWEDPNSEIYNRIIYFDYDKADVRDDGRELVTKHSAFLSANPAQKVRLEGHADERGSREYNIGLGERRGQAVRRLMLFQGVKDGQIETVSYGEERPAVEGHDESAWAKNRRVELVYN